MAPTPTPRPPRPFLRAGLIAAVVAAVTVLLLPATIARAVALPDGVSWVDGTQGDRSVTIHWMPPPDPEGSGFIGYVACLTVSTCVELSQAERSTTFTGLANGVRYQPGVAAVNSAGRGPFRYVDGGVMAAAVPGMPEGLDVVGRPGGLARISWSGAPGNGQDPHTFTLEDLLTGERRTLDVWSWVRNPPDPDGAGYWFQDVPVEPGASYDFSLTATNLTGTGPASVISFDAGAEYLLLPGDQLWPEEILATDDYSLRLQRDGNVVIRHNSERTVWHSWTWGTPGGRLAFQPDGNLVAYAVDGRVLWHTATWGHPDAALNLTDDGRLVIFDGSGNTLWSSRADQGQYWPWNSMEALEHLTAGQTLYSPNSAFRLTMQADGNAVVYGPGGRVLWHSWTFGRPGSRLVLQTDGNLVVYLPDRRAAWHAGTWGNEYSQLVMQDDGNLVVYSSSGRALWSSMYGRAL